MGPLLIDPGSDPVNDPCNYYGLNICDENGDCDSERFDCWSDCRDGSTAVTGQCPGDDDEACWENGQHLGECRPANDDGNANENDNNSDRPIECGTDIVGMPVCDFYGDDSPGNVNNDNEEENGEDSSSNGDEGDSDNSNGDSGTEDGGGGGGGGDGGEDSLFG